jgi:hypothetical protein
MVGYTPKSEPKAKLTARRSEISPIRQRADVISRQLSRNLSALPSAILTPRKTLETIRSTAHLNSRTTS